MRILLDTHIALWAVTGSQFEPLTLMTSDRLVSQYSTGIVLI